ncbi:hypothetical protein, partial [Pseudomonas savastanoi]|uniref:hypothetical protein n=1 Tax=Pseudomonas savastanoi TaxID=29438 RepID=UPI001E607CA0
HSVSLMHRHFEIPMHQAVFGVATSQPENNGLASIRTSTGFPPMTEISGIPAYNPYKTIVWT